MHRKQMQEMDSLIPKKGGGGAAGGTTGRVARFSLSELVGSIYVCFGPKISGKHTKMMFCLLVLVTSILGIPSAASPLDETNMMMMTMNPVVELSSRDELVHIAGYGEEKLSKVTISGRVVCHHACPRISRHLPPDDHYQLPNPISGASVAVVCSKSGKSWVRGTTDAYGDFLIDLPSHLHAIPNLEKVCILKLLHLPAHSHCRPAFRGKHKAIKLRSIDDGGARAYTTNTIALATKPSCTERVKTRNRKRMTHVY